MSQDGADLGIKAGVALKTVIGGEPTPKERMTPNEMRASLMEAKHPALFPDKEGEAGYSNAASYCGKLVLELFERRPELASVPMDSKYEIDDALAKTDWNAAFEQRKITAEGLDDAIRRVEPDFMQTTYDLGLSGFQWGWAVNAARFALDLPPVSNPAILTIG